VTESQVTESQVTESQVTDSQVTESQVTGSKPGIINVWIPTNNKKWNLVGFQGFSHWDLVIRDSATMSKFTSLGKFHCTIDLLFDWFGLVGFANKNKNFQLSYSWFQTSQTGGQQYSDISPFSIPWFVPPEPLQTRPGTYFRREQTNEALHSGRL
jgi:hypothetical protein